MLRPALVALALLAFPAAAQAAPLTTPCGGRAIAPDKVVTGEFDTRFTNSELHLFEADCRREAQALLKAVRTNLEAEIQKLADPARSGSVRMSSRMVRMPSGSGRRRTAAGQHVRRQQRRSGGARHAL